uniref:Protein KRI1 homolog n=1 Tax=Panagrolaimus superbus TaxID=310955 RepID=A0A914Z838_9BILA
MGKVKLDLGDESSEEGDLKINKNYAEKYEQWRSKEVLQKLKDKFKYKSIEEQEHNEEEDDSTSESEPEWTNEDEKSFLRALGALKSKDAKIYDKNQKFFAEKLDNGTAINAKPKKSKESEKKGMTLRDYEVALVTERKGKFDDEDMEQEPHDEGYFKKNQRLKDEFKAIVLDDEDSEEDDGFMKKRVKTIDEKKQEEENYADWLKGEGKELDIAPDDDIKKLKNVWNKPELDKNEQFLRDYLLNKQYDVDDNEDPEAPTYEDIVQDEAEIEKADNFEHKYNFRFEEPDQEFIKQFPRTVKESIRKGNEKRKEKRDQIKKRKDEELNQKKEEIKLLKTLKRKEIEEKLKKVKSIAGDDGLPLSIEDLEKDFDPKEYDKRMEEIFAKKYYDDEGDNEKPLFTDDSEDEASDYDNMQVGTVDGDVEDGSEEEDEQGEAERKDKNSSRKKKRNSKFKDVIHKKKPVFDPNEKTFDDYFSEYYSLDYEDIIADNLRTKFKYRNVPANSYALSTEEILGADDKQLNQWVSVKKASQYRSEKDEDYDRKVFEQKAAAGKKAKIFSKENNLDEPNAPQPKAKKITKKGQKKQQSEEVVETVDPIKRKNRRKNKSTKKIAFQNGQIQKIAGVDVDRLKAYNVSNKSLKRKIYGNANSTANKNQKLRRSFV